MHAVTFIILLFVVLVILLNWKKLFVISDNQENPELIWNDEAREKVSGVVSKMNKEWVEGFDGLRCIDSGYEVLFTKTIQKGPWCVMDCEYM